MEQKPPKKQIDWVGYSLILIIIMFVMPVLISGLPLPNIAKSIALRATSNTVPGKLIEHYCPGKNEYVYEFQRGRKIRTYSYRGYVKSIEERMDEEGCNGELTAPIPIDIKVVKFFPRWSEPAEKMQRSLARFILGILPVLVIAHFISWELMKMMLK